MDTVGPATLWASVEGEGKQTVPGAHAVLYRCRQVDGLVRTVLGAASALGQLDVPYRALVKVVLNKCTRESTSLGHACRICLPSASWWGVDSAENSEKKCGKTTCVMPSAFRTLCVFWMLLLLRQCSPYHASGRVCVA